ncbi:unnamed protein product [Bursaphelenchus okinawaensis]|uniref:Uncharacterized protein n=1 Tax=Bursaphelenchus okinawaensis TaxID=465554 RepID=A0A811L565_9BILA|nr:unnamed protein product [Bursaphelenchus okinawaensis]CAG9116642.1 unnamed protein product [Bursaphelenchus okinawaensis]
MIGFVNILLTATFGPDLLLARRYTVSVERGRGVCELPVVSGNCSKEFPRYYYDHASKNCHRFIYTGCGGNGNRFVSAEHCRQRCSSDWKPSKTKIKAQFRDPTITPTNQTICSRCHERNGICLNGQCQCRRGFEMVKDVCQDTNECLWVKCPPSSVCVNTDGSFHCECPIGFAGTSLNCTKHKDVCGQAFDRRYEDRCGFKTEAWGLRYYFDYKQNVCKQFWYGGCEFAESGNFFKDIQTCQTLCADYNVIETTTRAYRDTTTAMPLPEVCLDQFEERRRNPCKNGDWTQRYYYDHHSKKCQMFWFDASCTYQRYASRNVFILKSTCQRACEGVNPDDPDNLRAFEYKLVTPATVSFQAYTPLPHKYNWPIPTYMADPDRNLPDIYHRSKSVGVIQAHFSLMTTAVPPTSHYQEILDGKDDIEIDGFESGFGDFGMMEKKIVATPSPSLSISSDCLQPFDTNLTRSCSSGNQPWRPKYYYNTQKRQCVMYWNDGCMSKAKNNFEDLTTCQWMCEGASLKPEAEHCLDTFDKAYMDNCDNSHYRIKYYFNHHSKQCELFYYGGCRSQSRNIFDSYKDCQDLCHTPTRLTGDVCEQPFDPVYRDSCTRNGSYAQYYFYEQYSQSCKMFWYGNCKGKSQNIFSNLETCKWLCEKKTEQKVAANCLDRFDDSYKKACNNGVWTKRWYFDHKTGSCHEFWYDGCVGKSQNIFVDQETCTSLCEAPALPTQGNEIAIAEKVNEEKEAERCLEPLIVGSCSNRLPAYYYNQEARRCEPFMYSGCDGNGNRFLTLQQCKKSCDRFHSVKSEETACFHPLNAGYGRHNKTCIRKAGFRFYYNPQYQRCGRFWYFGCGGNENRFKTYEKCENTCSVNSLISADNKPISACFEPIEVGNCPDSSDVFKIKKFAYVPDKGTCVQFNYASCNGNDNNFDTQEECVAHCNAVQPAKSPQCQYQPDWGPCNMLRQQWFYNVTSGTCAQFLWGGCGGNTNRFETFEECQRVCEIPGGAPPPKKDPCIEKLDRGKWCEPMSNRYYYHQKSGTCKGFHYTGCGKSNNNFIELEDCQRICVRREDDNTQIQSYTLADGQTYRGVKPSEMPHPDQHIVLNEGVKRYMKTSGDWIDYGHCVGFRYNISGEYTRLNTYLCLMESGGSCEVKRYHSTEGEEHCRVLRPWLKGSHFYTWFFTVDRKPWKWSPRTRRRQSAQNTIASLIVLPVNDCHSAC